MRRAVIFDLPTAELCFTHILTEVGNLLGRCFSLGASLSGTIRTEQ